MNKPRKWWVAGLCNLLHPGIGQVYNGQARKGMIFLFLTNILLPFLFLKFLTLYLNTLSMAVLVTVVFATLAYYIVAVTDAVRVALRLQSDYQPKKYNKWYVYVGIVVAAAVVSVILPSLDLDRETIRSKYMQAYKLPSGSMEPTLLIGDHILVDQRPTACTPNRGDIIIFKYPEDETKDFVKRVEGIGGDIVEIRDKSLFINNKPVVENQVVHLEKDIFKKEQNPRDNFGPVTVPKDSYFVMGDNRDRAYDSRFWGFVNKSKVKGTVRQIYWSWDRKNSNVRWDRLGRKVL